MVTFRQEAEILAAPELVWSIMADLERWPQWTPSIVRIDVPAATPIGLGTTVLIQQPKLPPAKWTIIEWQPKERFTWVSPNPGVRATAVHAIHRTPTGVHLMLELTFEGLLAPLMAWLTGDLTRRYIAMEAAGLKAEAERRASQS
jgi:hypothetical protein